MDDDRVYILDMYNRGIYPQDGFAKRKCQDGIIRSVFSVIYLCIYSIFWKTGLGGCPVIDYISFINE